MQEFFKSAEKEKSTGVGSLLLLIYIIIFITVWVFSGITAFITSFICIAYNGSIGDKIIGILIAFLMGPFYWFYFSLNTRYCTRNPPVEEF